MAEQVTIVDFFYGETHEKSLWAGPADVHGRAFEFFGFHGGQPQVAVYTQLSTEGR